MSINPVGHAQPAPTNTPKGDEHLLQAAKDLEAAFLSEMLKATGFGDARQGLGGGGAGEDQFVSFLRDAYATEMVKSGGIGLAETLFHALKEAEHDQRPD